MLLYKWIYCFIVSGKFRKMQKCGQISGETASSIYWIRTIFVGDGDTRNCRGHPLCIVGVQYPLSVSPIYLLSFIYTRSLHTRRNETRVKSPDACNAFFIKVSTLSLSLSRLPQACSLYLMLNTYNIHVDMWNNITDSKMPVDLES